MDTKYFANTDDSVSSTFILFPAITKNTQY